jgi:hypothetical protein
MRLSRHEPRTAVFSFADLKAVLWMHSCWAQWPSVTSAKPRTRLAATSTHSESGDAGRARACASTASAVAISASCSASCFRPLESLFCVNALICALESGRSVRAELLA